MILCGLMIEQKIVTLDKKLITCGYPSSDHLQQETHLGCHSRLECYVSKDKILKDKGGVMLGHEERD